MKREVYSCLESSLTSVTVWLDFVLFCFTTKTQPNNYLGISISSHINVTSCGHNITFHKFLLKWYFSPQTAKHWKLENRTNGMYFKIGTEILPVFKSWLHLWADTCKEIIKTNMKFMMSHWIFAERVFTSYFCVLLECCKGKLWLVL